MKNIVIMCDTYSPKASPNGICAHEAATALVKRGYNVRVVTTVNDVSQKSEELTDGAKVFRVNPGFVVNNLISAEGKTDTAAKLRRSAALFVSGINGALNARRYPLTAPVQVKNYYRCAEKLYEEEKIDILVCCYHKVAAVAAGIKLKKRHKNMKFIVYTLDAISGGLIFPVLHSMDIPLKSLKRWEKRIFSAADSVYAMESHRSFYEKPEYDDYRSKISFLDIPLVRTDRLSQTKVNTPPHLVYTGSMSRGTANPEYLLSLLPELGGEKFIIDVYGKVNDDVEPLLAACPSLGKNIILHGKVPYEQIDGIQRGADILLNFGNANPCMIPCKIFEYISTGKKIISFTHSPSDSSLPYLEIYPNSLIVDENEPRDKNAELIRQFLVSATKQIREDELKKLFKKNTADYFCECIEKI